MNAASTVETIARIGGGLLVVVALVFISAKVARRVRGQTGDSGLRVIDRIVLSREAHLAVVDAGGRRLLLGVTPHRISLVGALDEDGPVDDAAARALAALDLGDAEHAVQPAAELAAELESVPAPAERLAAARQVQEAAATAAFGEVLAQAASNGAHALPVPDVADAPDYGTPDPGSGYQPGYLPDAVAADDVPLPTRRRRRARHAGAPPNDAPEPSRNSAAQSSAPSNAPEPERLPHPPQPAQPQPAQPQPAPAKRLTPSGVDLSGHPDLASALRAAGRTVTPPAVAPAPAQPVRPRYAPQAGPIPAPRPSDARARAEAAEAAETAAAQALIQAAQAHAQAHAQAQAEANQAPVQPQPAATADGQGATRMPQKRQQASGSVLSPATWKQGIEALRELTVRRG